MLFHTCHVTCHPDPSLHLNLLQSSQSLLFHHQLHFHKDLSHLLMFLLLGHILLFLLGLCSQRPFP